MKQLAVSLLSIVMVITFAETLTGCTNFFRSGEDVGAEITSQGFMSSKVDLNLHPMNKNICDPLGGQNTTQVMTQGVQGTLFYRTSSMPIFNKVQDYIDLAQKSDKTLFFADMNVPTRLFSEGFSTQTTGVLMDDSGNKLIEYFGIKFETNLQLTETDQDGDYELALLSDDGTRLQFQDPVDNTWKEIINNDGDHPTRMGCATRTIHMDHRTNLPIQTIYYQGPRYHIANILMWRKASVAGQDPACGTSGNTYFFDPDNNSVPLKPYNDLLARGWAPVAPGNFWLNNTASYNPCVQGTPPVISNFNISESFGTDVILSWTTNIPASTQVRLVNQTTGEETLTASDNMLGTDHQVHLSGLKHGDTYNAQAVSISQDLGNAISSPLTFTIQ